MTEEQAKKQDAKQEPVKKELTDEELSGISGGDIGYLGIARRDDDEVIKC